MSALDKAMAKQVTDRVAPLDVIMEDDDEGALFDAANMMWLHLKHHGVVFHYVCDMVADIVDYYLNTEGVEEATWLDYICDAQEA